MIAGAEQGSVVEAELTRYGELSKRESRSKEIFFWKKIRSFDREAIFRGMSVSGKTAPLGPIVTLAGIQLSEITVLLGIVLLWKIPL